MSLFPASDAQPDMLDALPEIGEGDIELTAGRFEKSGIGEFAVDAIDRVVAEAIAVAGFEIAAAGPSLAPVLRKDQRHRGPRRAPEGLPPRRRGGGWRVAAFDLVVERGAPPLGVGGARMIVGER